MCILHKIHEPTQFMIIHKDHPAELLMPDGRVQKISMLAQLRWMHRLQM